MLDAYKLIFTNVMRMFYGNISNLEVLMENLIELETRLAHIMCKIIYFKTLKAHIFLAII